MDRPGSSDSQFRIACVDLPAFPLQLLLHHHPDWAQGPAAVVDKDTPQGVLLWVNESARRSGILSGVKYAAGLSLNRELRAGTLSEEDIEKGVEKIQQCLRFFSPDVEPATDEPGVFWMNAHGLSYLYESLMRWAGYVQQDIAERGFQAEVAVGFSRFGTYAAAKCGRQVLFSATGQKPSSRGRERPSARGRERSSASREGSANHREKLSSSRVIRSAASASHPQSLPIVFRSREAERSALRYIPIDRLAFRASLRDTLAKLAIRTLGQFLDLPVSGVQKRFGEDAVKLHQLASGELWDPLDPDPILEKLEVRKVLDHPESDAGRILALLTDALKELLSRLTREQKLLTQMSFDLAFEDDGLGNRSETGEKKKAPKRSERLTPARPTCDEKQLVELLRLRIEAMTFPSGVVEMKFGVEGVPETQKQLGLFEEAPKRDLEAVRRAFADLRAEFGEHTVVRARLRDGHLPEARFCWEPVDEIEKANARPVQRPPLVRRILEKPEPLPSRPRHEPDGWLISGVEGGSAEEIVGPYIVSGGWWRRPIQREYHYVRTDKGRCLWVFYDRERRRWFLHGEVE